VLATAAKVGCNPPVERAGEEERGERTRTLSLPLLAGMLAAPPLFVWMFLRRGYPGSLRRAAFFYAAVMLAMALVAGSRA